MTPLPMEMKTVCVFCGSGTGTRPAYRQAAADLAVELARRKLDLVYGGGRVGLMGVLADAAREAGVHVTGVIPRRLQALEVGHEGLDELLVVETMTERKARMAEISDASLALPGGLGTLDELFEVLTGTQLGLQAKPCGLLNVAGYFDSLLGFLGHASAEGFLQGSHHPLLLTAAHPGELLDSLAAWQPVPHDKAAWALRQLSDKRRHT